jgi:hypothetical protein
MNELFHNCYNLTNFIIFAVQTFGRLTEWLGSGLQNHLRRFESATDLNKIPEHAVPGIFCFQPKMVMNLFKQSFVPV